MSLYERGLNDVLKALLDNGYFKLRTSLFDLFALLPFVSYDLSTTSSRIDSDLDDGCDLI